MKKRSITGWSILLIALVLMVVVMMSVVYTSIIGAKRLQTYQTSSLLIDQVERVLSDNEQKEESIVDLLKESYISKAEAVNKDLPLIMLLVFICLMVAVIVILVITKLMTNRIIKEHEDARVDVMTGLMNRREAVHAKELLIPR